MTSETKVQKILRILEDAKAERILVLDVRGKTFLADFFIVCTGNSDLHIRSISERVIEQMKKEKVKVAHIEGEGSGWALLDFGDVVCHVMREEQRQFYDIESLWKSLPVREEYPF